MKAGLFIDWHPYTFLLQETHKIQGFRVFIALGQYTPDSLD